MENKKVKFKYIPSQNKVKGAASVKDFPEISHLIKRIKKAATMRPNNELISGTINRNKMVFRFKMTYINDAFYVEIIDATSYDLTPPPIPYFNDYLEDIFERISTTCMAKGIKVNFNPLDTEVYESDILSLNKKAIDHTIQTLIQYFVNTKNKSLTITPLIKENRFHLLVSANGAVLDLDNPVTSPPLIYALNQLKTPNTRVQITSEDNAKHKLRVDYQLRNV